MMRIPYDDFFWVNLLILVVRSIMILDSSEYQFVLMHTLSCRVQVIEVMPDVV